MKNYFLFCVLLIISLVSCRVTDLKENYDASILNISCNTLDCLFEGGVVFTDVPQVIAQDDWEVSLPSEAWEVQKASGDIKLVAGNKEKHNLIMLAKEEFPGSFEQYSLIVIRSLREKSKLVSAKTVNLNDRKFMLIETIRSSARVWMWVTVKDGLGYGITCGGVEEDNDQFQHDTCFAVANTLKLK